MAFLGISMHLFQKKYITNMSGMLFLLFLQRLFQFGAKEGKSEGYYGEKNYLDMSFGGGEVRSSIKCVTLPAEVAGVKGTITADVVRADSPLLLGMPVLKRAKIVINLDTDEAMTFGKKLNLEKLSIGHYVLPLRPNYQKVEPDVCLITYEINSKVEKERLGALKKLYEKIAHPAQVKLEALIKNAGKWMASMRKELRMIYSQCETCKVLAKTPARSVVAMPRASTFNEVSTLDRKRREGKLILYMIDHFSRLTKGVFIKSKKLAEVVNAVMLHWVAGGFGRPASLHTDVGGKISRMQKLLKWQKD